MKNLLWTLMLAGLFLSCQSETKTENTLVLTDDEILAEIEMLDEMADVNVPEGAYYYDLASSGQETKEYMAALWGGQGIAELYYWSDAQPQKVKLHIISQERSNGEEVSGISMKVNFPAQPKQIYEVGVIEDRINLISPEQEFKEFQMRN
jgi:hypothetical protein